MAQVTVTKFEWIRDENGHHLYDEKAIEKFYHQQVKSAEKFNRKIMNIPTLQRSYSVIDPQKTAEMMVEMYKHNFRLYNEVVL